MFHQNHSNNHKVVIGHFIPFVFHAYLQLLKGTTISGQMSHFSAIVKYTGSELLTIMGSFFFFEHLKSLLYFSISRILPITKLTDDFRSTVLITMQFLHSKKFI